MSDYKVGEVWYAKPQAGRCAYLMIKSADALSLKTSWVLLGVHGGNDHEPSDAHVAIKMEEDVGEFKTHIKAAVKVNITTPELLSLLHRSVHSEKLLF